VSKCHYDDGGVPAEGKLVGDLIKENLQNKEVRGLDYTQFGSKKNACFSENSRIKR